MDKQLWFAPHITETTLLPDIAIKQVLMMELTVPWEEEEGQIT